MKSIYISIQITDDALLKISKLIDKYTARTKVSRQFQYYYIIDHILRNSEKNNNSVPLNQSFLAKILGVSNSLCSSMVHDLVDNEIIEVVKLHNHGYNSTHYAIPEKYRQLISISVKRKEVKVLTQIMKRRDDVNNTFLASKNGHLYMNYIANISITNISTIFQSISNKYVLLPNMDNTVKLKLIDREKTNVERIEKGDYWLKRPDEKSRVYCNLSILHREYRKYLHYKGKTLKCVDIRCSQPSLAGMMIKQRLLQNGQVIPKELETYLKACTSGQFYELFMEGDELLEENRKQFKQDFFKAVFFSRVTKRNNKLKKKFIDKFPTIYNIICEMKGGIQDKKDRTFAEFAKELQRFEASIIVDKVNIPMLQEGYGCYNIYDSIVSHDDATLIEATRRITEEFEKLGFTPKINIEDFTKY